MKDLNAARNEKMTSEKLNQEKKITSLSLLVVPTSFSSKSIIFAGLDLSIDDNRPIVQRCLNSSGPHIA